MNKYKDFQDIKIKQGFDQDFVDKQKEKTVAMIPGAKECKLVCITFTFVSDNEIESEYKMRAKNYVEDE